MQSQKELKAKADILFKFEEVKTGRKVTSIKFYIASNKSYSNNKAINEIAATTTENPLYNPQS